MAKLLIFRFRVTNSKLKKKKFHLQLLTFIFNFWVTNVNLINEKKFLKYYSLNVRGSVEIDTTP